MQERQPHPQFSSAMIRDAKVKKYVEFLELEKQKEIEEVIQCYEKMMQKNLETYTALKRKNDDEALYYANIISEIFDHSLKFGSEGNQVFYGQNMQEEFREFRIYIKNYMDNDIYKKIELVRHSVPPFTLKDPPRSSDESESEYKYDEDTWAKQGLDKNMNEEASSS